MDLWQWFEVYPRPVDPNGNVANPTTTLSRALQLRIARLHDPKEGWGTLYNTPYARWRVEFVFETITVVVNYFVNKNARQFVGAEYDYVCWPLKPLFLDCSTEQAASVSELLAELNALRIISKLVLDWHFQNRGNGLV